MLLELPLSLNMSNPLLLDEERPSRIKSNVSSSSVLRVSRAVSTWAMPFSTGIAAAQIKGINQVELKAKAATELVRAAGLMRAAMLIAMQDRNE